MKNLLDTFQKYDLLRNILLILLGLFILLKPNELFNGFVYIIAGYIAFLGVMNIIDNFKERRLTGNSAFGLTSGILFLFASLAILVLAKPLLSILPFIIGMMIFAQGLSHLIEKPRGPRVVNRSLWPIKIFYLLIMLAGLIIIFRPFKSMMLLLAVVVILIGISGVVRSILYRK